MVDIDKLQQMIDESSKIVFFGGAGVSTESGIPDFRSENGLYNQKFKYPAELMLSSQMFYSIVLNHKPCQKKLLLLELMSCLFYVI